jgi:hypothetical protein
VTALTNRVLNLICPQQPRHRARRARALGWLIAFGAGALTAGCGAVVPEPTLIREPRPEPVPLVIGLYCSDEFRSFVYRKSSGPRVLTAFALGEPSVKLVDEALGLLFARVVPVSGLPPKVSSENLVAGVIEPKIVEVSYEVPSGGASVNPVLARARITYAFTLYSREGEQLASWQVSGEGVETSSATIGVFPAHRSVQRSLEQAMREAAWNLDNDFRTVPGVVRWLENHGAK